MSDFCDSPMPKEFQREEIPEGTGGTFNGEKIADVPGRTPSPNAVKERTFDGSFPTPSGESDQF